MKVVPLSKIEISHTKEQFSEVSANANRKASLSTWPNQYILVTNSVLREWVLDNREVKSEEKMPFTLFEKCKWNFFYLRSRSRNESEMKMTGNRDREVKWKSFEIEIEKWTLSRIFENLKIIPDIFCFGFRTHLKW